MYGGAHSKNHGNVYSLVVECPGNGALQRIVFQDTTNCRPEAATICPAPVRCTLRPSSSPYTPHTPGLRRPARLASSSFGRHEYSRCLRQTSSGVRQHNCLMPPPRGRGIIIRYYIHQTHGGTVLSFKTLGALYFKAFTDLQSAHQSCTRHPSSPQALNPPAGKNNALKLWLIRGSYMIMIVTNFLSHITVGC